MFLRLEDTLDPKEMTLPIGFCTECCRDVVVYARPGRSFASSDIVWKCLFCDVEIDVDLEPVHYETTSDLKDLDYEPGGTEPGGGCFG